MTGVLCVHDNSTALVPVFRSVPRDCHKTLVSGLHLFQTYVGVEMLQISKSILTQLLDIDFYWFPIPINWLLLIIIDFIDYLLSLNDIAGRLYNPVDPFYFSIIAIYIGKAWA